MKFSPSYQSLPERFYAKSQPAKFKAPKLIAVNAELAKNLGLDLNQFSAEELALIFSGQKKLEGADFISLAYAGHQFGHFVPSLGDGRAMLMGEVIGLDQRRYDIHLKGPGQTAFSRRGDGRSALGPVIREYVVSEAMHQLGVPTTRALAAVETGELVERETPLPGGVFTRVASSHLRIGTFEYFASRGDLEGLSLLLDYAIKRHYPSATTALDFFVGVCDRQSDLIAKWMGLGFIHGVMNTDNMSISGETIDFGPCAFMDQFDFNQVYSFIDRNGRYAYMNQASILIWNLSQLANCLIPLVDKDEKVAVEKLTAEISKTKELFQTKFETIMLKKLGIEKANSESETLIARWLAYLQEAKLDFTLAFRKLPKLTSGHDAFYPINEKLEAFLTLWRPQLTTDSESLMMKTNPIFIPRNHQVERAIQSALKGDYSVFKELNEVLSRPFEEKKEFESYSLPPRESEKIQNTFCGT